MIVSYISGRLGNQLFEYAYVRSLLEQRGGKESIMFNFNLVKEAGTECDGFCDSLKYFNVFPYSQTTNNIVIKYGNLVQCLIYFLFKVDLNVLKMFEVRKWFTLNKK